MDFYQPSTVDEAVRVKAEHPDAVPIAGGTDVMVELNFDARRPTALLDLGRLTELAEWRLDDGNVRLGAAVSYTRIVAELGDVLPGLAMAARTVGSPQIRNRGTVGGNLGSASPAGDAHPPLLATTADVEVVSVRGTRTVPVREFFSGPKRSVLAPDELITAVTVPVHKGPQQFAKVGTRNAMVREAEEFAAAELPWDTRDPLPDNVSRAFGQLVAAAARPIDDVRGSAAYRRHALSVLARRTLGWAWQEVI